MFILESFILVVKIVILFLKILENYGSLPILFNKYIIQISHFEGAVAQVHLLINFTSPYTKLKHSL